MLSFVPVIDAQKSQMGHAQSTEEKELKQREKLKKDREKYIYDRRKIGWDEFGNLRYGNI